VANRQEGKIFQSTSRRFLRNRRSVPVTSVCPLVGSISLPSRRHRSARAAGWCRLNRPRQERVNSLQSCGAIAHWIATARFKSTMGDGSTWSTRTKRQSSPVPAIGGMHCRDRSLKCTNRIVVTRASLHQHLPSESSRFQRERFWSSRRIRSPVDEVQPRFAAALTPEVQSPQELPITSRPKRMASFRESGPRVRHSLQHRITCSTVFKHSQRRAECPRHES